MDDMRAGDNCKGAVFSDTQWHGHLARDAHATGTLPSGIHGNNPFNRHASATRLIAIVVAALGETQSVLYLTP
jgi:hypothetical protein